jgi:hypothetical protein
MKAKGPTTLTEMVAALPARVFRRGALLVVVTLGAGGAAAVWLQAEAEARIRAAIDAAVAPTAHELARHIADEAVERKDIHGALSDLRHELRDKEARDAARFDALYRVILERRPQPEAEALSRPVHAKDGGP